MSPEEERDRVIFALDRAVEEAQSFAHGDHAHFRDLVQRAREMHDLLLQSMREHPNLVTHGLDAFVQTTSHQINELELLAGTSRT